MNPPTLRTKRYDNDITNRLHIPNDISLRYSEHPTVTNSGGFDNGCGFHNPRETEEMPVLPGSEARHGVSSVPTDVAGAHSHTQHQTAGAASVRQGNAVPRGVSAVRSRSDLVPTQRRALLGPLGSWRTDRCPYCGAPIFYRSTGQKKTKCSRCKEISKVVERGDGALSAIKSEWKW